MNGMSYDTIQGSDKMDFTCSTIVSENGITQLSKLDKLSITGIGEFHYFFLVESSSLSIAINRNRFDYKNSLSSFWFFSVSF